MTLRSTRAIVVAAFDSGSWRGGETNHDQKDGETNKP